MMKRVKDDKSLVDIGMTAGVCRAFYQHNIDSFILAASDSDYWGLISALPNANFHLLLEHEKCGGSLREALETAKIPYSFMDNFCQGNIHDIKVGALLAQARPYLDGSIHLNIKSMLASLYERTRINMTPAEREAFYNRYIKSLKLNIDANGDVSIVIG